MGRIVNVSEAAALGLHAMIHLANHDGQTVPVAEIAESLDASANHMSKVLQRLARAGLVRSLRGPAGGFALARPTDAITLLDVYEEIDGPLRSDACLFDLPVCEGRSCVLGGLLGRVTEQVRGYLAGTTLADLQRAVGGREAVAEAVSTSDTSSCGPEDGSGTEALDGDAPWQHAGR